MILNPYAVPGEFRKAQLHCHTTESDGRFRPRELLQMYRDAGYSFVCITDHNRVTRCDDLNDNEFLAVPGTEDTVSRLLPPLGPHMGRLFVYEPMRTGTPQERIDQTLTAGGVVSLCHPSWNGNLWTGAWSRDALVSLRGYQLLEIWNPHSDTVEDTRRWDVVLQSSGRTTPVWGAAVDDCHRQHQFNRGWVMVRVLHVTMDALQQALRAGAFYASTGPSLEFSVNADQLVVRSTEPGQFRFLGTRGAVLHEVPGNAARYVLQGDESYVRVEVTTSRGRAWSQPFWLASSQD